MTHTITKGRLIEISTQVQKAYTVLYRSDYSLRILAAYNSAQTAYLRELSPVVLTKEPDVTLVRSFADQLQ